MNIALIAAAGRGFRAMDKNNAQKNGDLIAKQYKQIKGKPLLYYTIQTFLMHKHIDKVIPVIHKDDLSIFKTITFKHSDKLLPPAYGETDRQSSIFNGLKAVKELKPNYILIHDGARPCIGEALISRIIDRLKSCDALIPALPVTNTLKQAHEGAIIKTVPRADLYAAQTPQAFRFDLIYEHHLKAKDIDQHPFTDDASILEWFDVPVHIIKGADSNIKVTRPEDFALAEFYLKKKTEINK